MKKVIILQALTDEEAERMAVLNGIKTIICILREESKTEILGI